MNSIEKYCVTTETRKSMVMLYGNPTCGKTTGALTFPKPYLINFDNNVPPGTINTIPMWDDNFVDKIKPRMVKDVANRRDALLIILSSISVILETNFTSYPENFKYFLKMSKVICCLACPKCGTSFTVGPQTYIRTEFFLIGLKFSFFLVNVLYNFRLISI